MTVTLDLPSSAEDALRRAFGGDLSEATKEALIIRGYQLGKLSLGDIREILGLPTRFQVEDWLGKRSVNWNYSLADLEEDRKTLGELFKVEL